MCPVQLGFQDSRSYRDRSLVILQGSKSGLNQDNRRLRRKECIRGKLVSERIARPVSWGQKRGSRSWAVGWHPTGRDLTPPPQSGDRSPQVRVRVEWRRSMECKPRKTAVHIHRVSNDKERTRASGQSL